jgi:hypothetical protein
MDAVVYRTLTLLCAVVTPLPIGTNRGLLDLLWMLLSGRLLAARGALFPALSDLGWPAARVRRAWAALGQGAWTVDRLLTAWAALVVEEGRWQPHTHDGYQPVAVDLTGFWRPRLRDCPTRHYHGAAGKALPAIPVGVIARIGSVGTQRLGLPLALVRADAADPRPAAQTQALLTAAVARAEITDLLVVDRGFGVAALQAAQATRFVARLPQNGTARRATPPRYLGRGRPPTRGVLIRPLARTYRGRTIAATPPDAVTTWNEDGTELRAETWTDLVLPAADADADAPVFQVIAVHDPRHPAPLLLASSVALSPRAARDLYADRWPVEQLPLAAKQLLGAERAFVSAPEICQRLPEVALVAGAILSYLAATTLAPATGFWDRRPRPTAGRLRRLLGASSFPELYPFPVRLRKKAAVTRHLPTGFWGQRHRRAAGSAAPTPRTRPRATPKGAPVSEN